MSESKPNASEVLDRLSSSYGVKTQKELAVCLEISPGNVSAWVQRGSVPGNAIIKCALDTGADLKWLVSGLFANANANANVKNTNVSKSTRADRGKTLLKKMLSAGGKSVLKRILDAYGFTTQKELSEYLEISTGTISTWVRREYFPGDVVITCALDTGASLEWLATGEMNTESQEKSATSGIPTISKKMLVAGKLDDDGFCYIDESFVPDGVDFKSLNYVRSGKSAWLIEMGVNEISNGSWLLDIDGTLDVYAISRRPGNKLRISGHDGDFECLTNEVTAKGLVVVILQNSI
ncbi:bacteriophage CI repressor-like protein [Rahnella sp. BIGb0236]|uniref:helix-turn-helix domain-containing protein n=1 Tax=Rahnella sp. BIGb0236 TaxID=2485117 RepID=UPI00105CA900|nr:helix-turn-helix domain-containing protein [Rahnella sp. BIGb0236]TDS96544.1 bacteriophage CI repressor-like protein [Rahnella sp. BIGb0236]